MDILKKQNGSIEFKQGIKTIATANNSEIIISEYNDNGKARVMVSTDGRIENVIMLIDPVSVDDVFDAAGNSILNSPTTTQELIDALQGISSQGGDVTPNKTYTRAQALTGVLVALADDPCSQVTLRNNTNDVIYTANGGAQQEMMEGEVVTIYCSDANQIEVTGNGNLNYLVDKNEQ